MQRINWRLTGLLLAVVVIVGGLGLLSLGIEIPPSSGWEFDGGYGGYEHSGTLVLGYGISLNDYPDFVVIGGLEGDGEQFNGVTGFYDGQVSGYDSYYGANSTYYLNVWGAPGWGWYLTLDDNYSNGGNLFGGTYFHSLLEPEPEPEPTPYIPPTPTTVIPTGDAGGGSSFDGTSTTYTAGDSITGSLKLLDGNGNPDLGAIHIFVYGPDGSIVTHFRATFDWPSREYQFSVDTTGFAPGQYTICVSVAGGGAETLTVDITP